MARTNDNIILQKSLWEYRKTGGTEAGARKDGLIENAKKPAARSAKQQMCAQGFKLATAYAKSVMQNPELKALYSEEAKRRGVINAYNMALSDCLRLPEIKAIDIANYTGKALGEVITIEVADTFKVVEVTVSIINDVTTIEEGSAIFVDNRWEYVTTSLNAAATDSKVVVTAIDRAGNKINKSF